MPARMIRLTAGAMCHLLLWCCTVSAQPGTAPGKPEEDGQPPSKRPQSASPQVEESRPALYYLKDEQGKLVAVPGFTYEEFEELFKLKERLARPDRRPRYVLQSISATGTAGTRHAKLNVQVRVLVREEGWVRVPLGFDRAFLTEPAEYQGPGEGFVHFEAGGQGHVSWIRGPAGEEHELRLNMLAPLADVGDETRLKLLAPRATISQLKLTVPLSEAVGKVSEGAELLASSGIDSGTTEFTVLGLGGDFVLTWHILGRQPAEQPTVLEAEGTVLARIDARGVDTEATLKVHASGAPFDRFRVRLPPGARLVPNFAVGSSGYSVAPVENDAVGAPQHPLVEVRLTEKKSGPVEVRLATWRPHDLSQPEEWFELGGFEVVDAARQWGHVDIAADSNWQVIWGDSRGARRVEPLPLEDVVAGFDFHAQPYSLTARLVSKRTRISVEPVHQLLVDADRVQLDAALKYTIRGAKAFKLDVALPAGWESVEVGPETLVAVDRIAVTGDTLLSIPLLQPSTGKMELQIRAQWPIPEGSGSLVLPLPQPQADWPAPAEVAVAPADNVQLTPNHEAMVALIRQPPGAPLKLPDRKQPPLFYRAEAPEAVFAADFIVHARQIAAEVTSLVSLDRQAGEVEQTLAYTIAYEPADHLIILVPRSLAASGKLELQCDGRPLTPALLPGAADQQDTSEPVRMQIDLPKACIGACELKVRYPFRFQDLVPGVTQLVHQKPIVLRLPLVMPEGGSLASNKLRVTAPPEIEVRRSGDAGPSASDLRLPAERVVWQEVARRSGSPPRLQLSTDQPTAQVELEVELDEQRGTTVVERAWVQTRLIPPTRRDRAVLSFTGDQKELLLAIPPGATIEELELDGKRIEGQPDERGRLIIPLPAARNLRAPGERAGETNPPRHLLEVRSVSARERQPPGRLSMELPRLAGDVPVYEMYWQLVLPWNEHVIATPNGLTNEFTWQWDGYFWGRKPLLDQSELETWVRRRTSASSGTMTGPRGMNCYLFSSMGNVERCVLRTAWRSWILLSASGVALVVGLVLIYVRQARHPATLLVAAVVLLCVGILYYPEPALLLAQAASLGLALALLAGLLERSVARQRRATTVLEPPSAVLEKASTQTHYPLPPAGTPSSTQTAPAVAPPSTPDSNT